MSFTGDIINATTMDRRNSIGLIGVGSLIAVQNVFPSIPKSGKTETDSEFIRAFTPRWEGLRTHTFEVMEAMPPSRFAYKPTADVMSYAKLFSHIGKSLDIYAGMLDGSAHEQETESEVKEEVYTYLTRCFDRFEQALAGLDSDSVYSPTNTVQTRDGDIEMSDYDVIMLAYNHTVHHKGQATTYLRLAGMAPPQYRY